MNSTILKKSVTGVFLLFALSMSACAKKDGSSGVRIAGRGTGTGVTQNNVAANNTCTNANMTMGKIFDPMASPQFEQQVKGFVSATLDPQGLGSISGNINDKTGIDFTGTFKFDAQGNLVKESSSLLIKIFDSYVGQVYEGQTISAYVVEFVAGTEGNINRTTRQFTVKFKDTYGEITLQGRYDNQTVEGQVTYQNYVSAVGGQPAQGTLGTFRAYTCALIK